MRRTIPMVVCWSLTPAALCGPVLVEDVRDITVFAQASDTQGHGDPIGPVTISRSAPGAFFAEQQAVVANSPGFGVNAVAGGIQFSRFHDGPGALFTADGAAEVQLDLLDPLGTGQVDAVTRVRLVFELSEDTAYDLSGELTMFAIGEVAADVRVTLTAAGGVSPWFERTAAGAFASSGVLEEGTWVLELYARALSVPGGIPIDSSSAVGTFRDVSFALAPAPGTLALLGGAALLAGRRRR